MKPKHMIVTCVVAWLTAASGPVSGKTVDLSAELLQDKIRGGLLGQILGNLNGLPYEMKYIDEPGNVTDYTPSLPQGARTDDDTDFEWVYIYVMQNENTILLKPQRIAQLWTERINRRIWCSNQYARQLMDLGVTPPHTGMIAFNPWAEFNISGQFICETFGLIAPGMPQTGSRTALNYTRVTIDAEPAQTTQLFATMIAVAFLTDDIDHILDAGAAAIDPDSKVSRIVHDVRTWHQQNPNDWRAARLLLKDKYSKWDGAMRDRNGYELNTGSTIAALLYGRGDFIRTLTTAFNFGWDADNTAATAGTIIGVTKGYRWMLSQGWQIVDRYENTTRDNMPTDETITSFADRLADLAERVISEQGGRRRIVDGRPVYRIRIEEPGCVLPLQDLAEQTETLRSELRDQIKRAILKDGSSRDRARAAYYAICLDLAETMRTDNPQEWQQAVNALQDHWNVVQAIFHHSPVPFGQRLREKALGAGLAKPDASKNLW